jgi:2-polyprenyl-3-methyl-5-hydroxy-6-metoxy-1,4-benzoquinol methylase
MFLKKNLNTLHEIYTHYEFNPVEYNLNNKNFKNFENQRKNLFEDYLKIPLRLLNDKKLIEFGPANGEKTLIYAKYGAELTVVEPNKKFLNNLKKNLGKFNVKFNSYNTFIENFKTNNKYDFVILENFLTSIKKRNLALKNVTKTLNKNGFIIFTYHNPEGFFLEYFKKFILNSYTEKKNLKKINQILFVAKKFFSKKFSKISHTRNFNQYMMDNFILNDFIEQTFWDFNDIIKTASSLNLRFYSSWPNYNSYQSNWHKNILSTKDHNNLVLKNYNEIKGHFVCKGHFYSQEQMKFILKIFKIMFSKSKTENNLKKILKLIKISKFKNDLIIDRIYKTLINLDPKSYNTNFNFDDWGFPNHYLCFIKK